MPYKVRALREKRHMTQTELAEKAGVSRQTINNIENGRSTEITASTLIKLAKTLGCLVDDLVE